MTTLLRFGVLLAVAAVLVPSAASAALSDAQTSSVLALLRSFGTDASTVASVEAALRGSAPGVATPSCTITSSLARVVANQKLAISWESEHIGTPVMMIDDGTKRYWLAGTSGASEWTAGPKAAQYVFALGYGASGTAPFSPVCSVTVVKG
jgi:hypothetical protein